MLTVGAAALFAVLVFKTSLDVWVGRDPVDVDKVLGGVMVGLSITLGSAFVGWFGVTATTSERLITGNWYERLWRILTTIFTNLEGAAVFAMTVYLVSGAFAGLTYIFRSDETPTVLITVATAWAAQAVAIVAATLASVLKPPPPGTRRHAVWMQWEEPTGEVDDHE